MLETLDIVDNKEVMEVLKDGVTEEDIIFESEVAEDAEETEIEEIIEIIEEIEECDETLPDDELKDKDNLTKDNDTIVRTERSDQVTEKNIEIYGFDEENSMFTSQSITEEVTKSMSNNTLKSSNKQVINYDVDEDWQDEELERIEELDNAEIQTQVDTRSDKRQTNNQIITIPFQTNKLDLKIHMDSMGRSDKSRADGGIGSNVNMEDGSNTTHQIVKNVENNLLYTVLGTKKPDSSAKQVQEKHTSREGEARYIKVSSIFEILRIIGLSVKIEMIGFSFF